ncbi:flagellar hook capping FlgD N-terminal domain-containing protein [Marimonas sp. MJW-29]|uniref:Basal-body rod modification protein FlgD n=1 Tax=Sulfitobacter sediminis TaxID=3234186 RepID=A0ABV3RIZ4_9RHOB
MDATAPLGTLPPSVAAAGSQASSVLSSDFETFLRMLTAQARFQDPLEPIDSSEYAAQLAQFSMVEQQVLSNDLLRSLAAQLGAGSMAQMAGWIGMEALSTAPVYFDGTPVTLNPAPARTADEAFLVIKDDRGQVVQRLNLPLASDPVQWAGVSNDNRPFPSGLYSFEVESRSRGEVIGTEPIGTYARITEARLQGQEILLILESGATIPSSSVTGLREPQ